MVIKKKRVLIPRHKRLDFSSFENPIGLNWIDLVELLEGFLGLWFALFLMLWWWVCTRKVGERKWGVGHF